MVELSGMKCNDNREKKENSRATTHPQGCQHVHLRRMSIIIIIIIILILILILFNALGSKYPEG